MRLRNQNALIWIDEAATEKFWVELDVGEKAVVPVELPIYCDICWRRSTVSSAGSDLSH